MIKPEIDAEFASLIPPLSSDEYTQLEANLLAEGCRDRLVIWGDILIDGHNRLQICEKHNIPYEVVKCEFADRDGAMKYIILNQFGRRNLSIGDRSLLALKLEPLYKAQAKDNQRKSLGRGKKGVQQVAHLFPSGEKTRDKIAKIAGVSHTTIDRVSHIVEKGTPEQVSRIKEGGKGNTVNAVYKEVRKTHTPNLNASDGSYTEYDDFTITGDAGIMQESPDDFSKKDELRKIRGYVADLKNPDLDRSYTTEMFLGEYNAFAERFIRSIGTFGYKPYVEIYLHLSDAEQKELTTLGDSMIKAIEKQNSNIRNDKV